MPSYLKTFESGKLAKIAEQAFVRLSSCDICPRKCSVNRLKNEKGVCRTGRQAAVYSFLAHHGEEPPISGLKGSGTIFFSNCNMGCAYCQNFEFSQKGGGKEVSEEELADIMLKLQTLGCHNINFVTPTHVMPQILKSLCLAIPKGLHIPLVYNTSGYELAEIIKMLEGIIDIYLPDMRYADEKMSVEYSCAPQYPQFNQQAIGEMHRQVKTSEFDKNGLIYRGMIIRHLVLPNNISGTEKILRFIAQDISKDTYISLMSQYHPYYKATKIPELNRMISQEEYRAAQDIMEKLGLENGWTQDSHGLESLAGVHIKPNQPAQE